MQLSIANSIGKGYGRGWFTNCKCRYRCFKGARNTKKSYNLIGFEVLCKIFSDSRRNVLILRNTLSSNRLSTFTTLCKIISMPDMNNPEISLSRYFKIDENEMIITYKPTKQQIIFKGMDNPDKIQSIRTAVGFLTDVYVEEAFEIKNYEKWRKVDGSIRGKLPFGLFHQITFIFNSWSKNHWLYEEFFKGRLEDDLDYLLSHDYQDWEDENLIIGYGKGLYLHTSTYKINEFRDMEIYDLAMEQLRERAPEIYKVEALGMWGSSTGATYPEFSDVLIQPRQIVNNFRYDSYAIGIDTGLSNGEGKAIGDRLKSATTMQLCGITSDYNNLVCIDEYFYSNERELYKKTEPELMEEIFNVILRWCEVYAYNQVLMKGVILVYVDCADIGFRQGLEMLAKQKGIYNIRFIGSTKMRIQTRVDFERLLMAWGNIVISNACENLIREIKNSHKGENGEPREDFDDHAINANEYAWAPIISRLKRWGSFKKDGR